jgi:hypothetical protein
MQRTAANQTTEWSRLNPLEHDQHYESEKTKEMLFGSILPLITFDAGSERVTVFKLLGVSLINS